MEQPTNTLTVTGVLAADNYRLTVTHYYKQTNGNVTIDPNGTGVVDVSNPHYAGFTINQNGDAANKQYVDDELAALTVMTMPRWYKQIQTITAGDTMTFAGTPNEVEVEAPQLILLLLVYQMM